VEPPGQLHWRQAQAAAAEAERLLLKADPESVEHAAIALRGAVENLAAAMESSRAADAPAAGATATEVRLLRNRLTSIQALLHNAARFYAGWAALVCTQQDGYAPGTPQDVWQALRAPSGHMVAARG
jgi:hypothetical protein